MLYKDKTSWLDIKPKNKIEYAFDYHKHLVSFGIGLWFDRMFVDYMKRKDYRMFGLQINILVWTFSIALIKGIK